MKDYFYQHTKKWLPYRPFLCRPFFNAGPFDAGPNSAGFENEANAY